MIDLRPDHLAIVQGILAAEAPESDVWAFGSRARWTSTDASDLDLAVLSPSAPLPFHRMDHLRQLFEESTLPFNVDVVDLLRVDDDFRQVIDRDKHLLSRAVQKSPGATRPWEGRLLADCVEFLSGGTPSKRVARFWNGEIPWVSAKDMKRFRLWQTRDHVTEEGLSNGTRLAPAHSTLILVRGMALHNDIPICEIQREMAFNQDVRALVPHANIAPQFLSYFLLAQKPMIAGLVDSASHGMGRINSPGLKSLPIAVPPLDEQKRIAKILGTLDDKIELNQKMNQTLEAMAQALFNSWFTGLEDQIDDSSLRNQRRMGISVPSADTQNELDRKLKPLFERAELNSTQSRTLAQIRETLLPKLISGEIRVPEAEQVAESTRAPRP